MKKKKKIDRIAEELRRIAKKHGGLLLPKVLVAEARAPRSILHSQFEWNNSVAADGYRLWQARQLIRVCVEMLPGVSVETEIFVSLTEDRFKGRGYRVMTEVLSDAELRRQLLQDAFDELELFKLKYRRLRELVIVFSAIRKTQKRHRRG